MRRIKKLEEKQESSGSWNFTFEGPILTDCFMILSLRTLNVPAEDTIDRLLQRILRLQTPDGFWQLYEDESEGNLSATIQAYTAMLVSGRFSRGDKQMKKAEAYIKANGGIARAHFMTKMMLAVNGFYKYPHLFYFPMTYFMLPQASPLSMFHCSNYARVHLTPMVICLNKRFTVSHRVDTSFFQSQFGGGWFREDRDSWGEMLIKEMKSIALAPYYLHQAGYESAKKLMLDRLEKNGTLYSYVTATFYLIYALMAMGYKVDSIILKKAIDGMLSYAAETKDGLHIQNSPSTIWDTALLSYSLQEAGMGPNDKIIVKANQYLMEKQQKIRGDWAVNAPAIAPGGWGFSESNHFNPDNDDTSAALRALTQQSVSDVKVKNAWQKGLGYLLGMQNKDGGWGAFEKNAYQPILAYLPIENAKDALIDDSTADLTGRVLEYLGNFAGYTDRNQKISKAVKWLLKNQQKNGSWYGKWGVCYIYGTWAALTGMRSVGTAKDHPAILRAADWLEAIQRHDGGWGESCASAEKETYVPLPFSTPSQTAWALDALLTVRSPEDPAIRKAVQYLLKDKDHQQNARYYPTGLGLPGGYYIYYESYNEIFPLLALAHYYKNRTEGDIEL